MLRINFVAIFSETSELEKYILEPYDSFYSDWRDDASVASACSDIYRYVESSRLDNYSFAQMRRTLSEVDDAVLISVLQYLSSPRWNILHQVFLFIDDNDSVYELTQSEVAIYIERGCFPHPESGYLISDLSQILVAYELGQYFQGDKS